MIAINYLFENSSVKRSTAFSAGLVLGSLAALKARSEVIKWVALSMLCLSGQFLCADFLLYRDCAAHFKNTKNLTKTENAELDLVKNNLVKTNYAIIPFALIFLIEATFVNVIASSLFKRSFIRASELAPHFAASVLISLVATKAFSLAKARWKFSIREVPTTGCKPLDYHLLNRQGYTGLFTCLAYLNVIIFLKRIAWIK